MKIRRILIAAVLGTVLAACTNENNPVVDTSSYPSDGIVRVTARVENPLSRAGMNGDNLQQFYLYIGYSGDDSYTALMQKEDGIWNSYTVADTTDLIMYWKNSTTKVGVLATTVKPDSIFPKGGTSVQIKTDQSNEANFTASDYLYAENDTIVPSEDLVDGVLPITLKHLCSKVDITLKMNTEFNSTPGTDTNPVTDLKVSGTYTTRERIFVDDMWQASLDVADVYALELKDEYQSGSGTDCAVAKYSVILLPQSVGMGKFTVSFTINGQEYSWTSEATVKLETGKEYTLDLTVGKEAASIGDMSIGNWNSSPEAEAETDDID